MEPPSGKSVDSEIYLSLPSVSRSNFQIILCLDKTKP